MSVSIHCLWVVVIDVLIEMDIVGVKLINCRNEVLKDNFLCCFFIVFVLIHVSCLANIPPFSLSSSYSIHYFKNAQSLVSYVTCEMLSISLPT